MSLSTPPVAGCIAAPGDDAVPSHGAWDAGDLGCGELILELRMRVRARASGQVLRLTARDSGAAADIPAWCGMTGHRLLHHDPAAQVFFIQRL